MLSKTTLLSLLFAIALSVAAARTSGQTEVTLPDTPAGRTFSKFLEALNSGQIEKMRRFHADLGGDTSYAEKDLEFFNQSGGLKPVKVIKSTDHSIEILARTRQALEWIRIAFEVSAEPPHAPTTVRVQPADGVQ
jgi:hypothetical protein